MESPGSKKRLHAIPGAAERLGVADKTLRNWIDAGKVNVYRVGGRAIRISEDEIERILNESFCPARRSA